MSKQCDLFIKKKKQSCKNLNNINIIFIKDAGKNTNKYFYETLQ